jgi:hypothetical protein
VDVREATPYQRLRATDPHSAAIAMTYGQSEMREPVWSGELEKPSGKPLARLSRIPAAAEISTWAARRGDDVYRVAPDKWSRASAGARTMFNSTILGVTARGFLRFWPAALPSAQAWRL